MKINEFSYRILLVIVFSFCTILISSCKKNREPTCLITYPVDGQEIREGTIVTISVLSTDSNLDIPEVRFYIDNIFVSSNSYSSHEYDWNTTDLSEGTHTIKVVAVDDEAAKNSSQISIKILKLICPNSISDVDGNVYDVVKIGSQCWMAENLKTTHYANGAAIPLVTGNDDWAALEDNDTNKAYCYYDNSSANATTYGALYNWTTAMNGASSSADDIQGVCPDGWHLPSYSEWITLIDYLDGEIVAGGKLKESETSHWDFPNTGADNSSGFTALPGGYRSSSYGSFSSIGSTGCWWSVEDDVWLGLSCDHAMFIQSWNPTNKDIYKSLGLSVRCVQD